MDIKLNRGTSSKRAVLVEVTEQQLTIPRPVDDHRAQRPIAPQDHQLKRCLVRRSPQGKWGPFHCLLLRHFSMHAGNNLSEKLQRKIDKTTRYRMWGTFC